MTKPPDDNDPIDLTCPRCRREVDDMRDGAVWHNWQMWHPWCYTAQQHDNALETPR